ncbi:hypothetical protein [Natronosalvus rutilus]|uniref:Uncharacterized protein n=1 Tax=Natronosalvus rutilus TaxID=2953753 RepID=A0A9E7SUK2_9EURY|nr:hypothetical protein [Natronosalvus rutilus]UTF52962.1 hypothetical protein NGM29_14430 [Natronosalvus rutilus]
MTSICAIYVEVGEYTIAESLEWLADAAKVVLRVRDEGGEVTNHQYEYTCLEHAFLLLDRLEKRESGRMLWGTGLVNLRFNDETVTLGAKPRLTGPVGEFRAATEALVAQLFEYLRRHDIDAHEVATNIAEGRFALWEIDPANVHDRVLD